MSGKGSFEQHSGHGHHALQGHHVHAPPHASGRRSGMSHHKVRAGETLAEVARRHNMTLYALATANHIKDPNRIFVGQLLLIPGAAGQTASGASSHPAPRPVLANSTPGFSLDRALGALSRKYESGGGPGIVSSGKGDAGGVSYGAYQLASKTGTAKEFVDSIKQSYPLYYAALAGKTPGTAEFSEAWKALAQKNPGGFLDAQHAFIKATHYDPQVVAIQNATNLDVTTRSRTLQDVAWSTAVQHRDGSVGIFKRALNGHSPAELNDEQLIKAIYAERGRRNKKNELVHFTKCTKAVQESVAKRYVQEQKDALAALAKEKTGGGPMATKATPQSRLPAPPTRTPGATPAPPRVARSTSNVTGQVATASAAQLQAWHIEVPYFSQFKVYKDPSGKNRFPPGSTSCFAASKAMAGAAGATVLGPDKRIQVGTGENGTGQLDVDRKKAAEALHYIDAQLAAGRPVVVGVSHKHADYNVDKLTDHFVVITGRTVDEHGRICYPFHDPGTTNDELGKDTRPTNRFYVDGNGKLFRDGKLAQGYVLQRRLEVAMVRMNR